MLSWDYFRNPITGIVKLGWDAVSGNIKTDGNANTPADYVAPVVNNYVETKTQQLVPKPAQEWVEEKVTEPIKDTFKIVGDTVGNVYSATAGLVGDGVDTLKKYAPLAIAGIAAAWLLKK